MRLCNHNFTYFCLAAINSRLLAFEGIFIDDQVVMATSYPTYSTKMEQCAMRSCSFVEINTDDTESDIAIESAYTEIEALIAFAAGERAVVQP